MNARAQARTFRTSIARAWDGTGRKSQVLRGHEKLARHEISIASSAESSDGIAVVRLRPTGMSRLVTPRVGMETIDLSVTGGSTSIVVDGFYDLIQIEFTQAPPGLVDVQVTSSDPLLASPDGRSTNSPVSTLANDWDGVGAVGKIVRDHSGLVTHHVAISASRTPSSGILLLQGKPVGSGYYATLEEVDLTASGSANLIVRGHFEAFRLVTEQSVTGGTQISARIASTDRDLNPPQVLADGLSTVITEGGASVPYHLETGGHYIVPNGIQALFDEQIELMGTATLEVYGLLMEQGEYNARRHAVPYNMASGSRYVLADGDQAFFQEPIELEGTSRLELYGLLIEEPAE